MAIRPIAFTGAMVSALLDGRKVQTRRVLKPQPKSGFNPWQCECTGEWWQSGYGEAGDDLLAVPYAVGDLLYVRERHYADMVSSCGKYARILYSVDDRVSVNIDWPSRCRLPVVGKNRPPMFLPREYSRLTLKVTDVRVERVKQISEADAKAEGVRVLPLQRVDDPSAWWEVGPGKHQARTPRGSFRSLWGSINSPRGFGWQENPWVVAVSFSVIRANVDQLSGPQAQAEDTERERSEATTTTRTGQ